MSVRRYLESTPLKEIILYKKSDEEYSKRCIPFRGNPRKHPYDKEKILLIEKPFSSSTAFYEFKLEDVTHVDDQASLVTETGESLRMVELWVKKGSFALQYEPFEVE